MIYELYLKGTDCDGKLHYSFIKQSMSFDDVISAVRYEKERRYIILKSDPCPPINYYQLGLDHVPTESELYDIVVQCKMSKNLSIVRYISNNDGLMSFIDRQVEKAEKQALRYVAALKEYLQGS